MTKAKPTVMVIEDEELLLRAITKEMQVLGIEVLSCTSATQAIDYLQTVPVLPDVIWLDYYLKDMNGLDFLQRVKGNTSWAYIPVLVVSNSASHDKVTSMMALGADQYVLKADHTLDQIIGMVRDLIDDEE